MQKNESGALPNIQKEINSKQIKTLNVRSAIITFLYENKAGSSLRSVLVKVFRPASLAKAKN